MSARAKIGEFGITKIREIAREIVAKCERRILRVRQVLMRGGGLSRGKTLIEIA